MIDLDAIMRPEPVYFATAGTDEKTLRLLALDTASVDVAWNGTLDAIRAEGRDPDAVVLRTGEVLTAWRNNTLTPEPR